MMKPRPPDAYPRRPERLVCVTARPDEPAQCECERTVFTPRVVGHFSGTLDIDWVRCSKCQAHVVVRVTG